MLAAVAQSWLCVVEVASPAALERGAYGVQV